jgi:uncharacterized protein (DUF2336 family)
MIVRSFLLWARNAPVQQRADATRVLAKAYLCGQMVAADLSECETAFLALTQDPSPLVRRALAEELACSAQVPRALVCSLVAEGGEPAALMLRLSPRLSDSELVDAAAIGDEAAQIAVASRETVSLEVAAALAEIGQQDSLLALLGNPNAEILPGSFERMLERFGDVAPMREALLVHPDLPPGLRQKIAGHVSSSLTAFAVGCGWMSRERAERIARDSTERVAISIAATSDADDLVDLVHSMREDNRLTPALMLRALVFAEPALAEAAFASLAGIPLQRATSLMYDRRAVGFPSLYRRAGLPAELQRAFSAAVAAIAEAGHDHNALARAQTARRILERVISACEHDGASAGGLLALLRCFEADCAREEAQHIAGTLADDAALMLVIRADPGLLIDHAHDARDVHLAKLAA